MKSIIISIVFFLFLSNSFSQNREIHRTPMDSSHYASYFETPEDSLDSIPIIHSSFRNRVAPIILFASSIALDAIGTGLVIRGQKPLGHAVRGLSIATLFSTPFISTIDKKKWWVYAISYTSLRVAFYDPILNLTVPDHLNRGGYSLTDPYWNQHRADWWSRSFFIGVGVFIPLDLL